MQFQLVIVMMVIGNCFACSAVGAFFYQSL